MSESIVCDIDLSRFTKAMNSLPMDVFNGVREGMKKGGAFLVAKAREEYLAKPRKHTTGPGSHSVEKSIQTKMLPDYKSVVVGINTEVSPHAIYIHEGTKDHMVPKAGHVFGKGLKKDGKAASLHWVGGGESFFSKGHEVSGIEKDQFLYRAAQKNEKEIEKIIITEVDIAIKAAGY